MKTKAKKLLNGLIVLGLIILYLVVYVVCVGYVLELITPYIKTSLQYIESVL